MTRRSAAFAVVVGLALAGHARAEAPQLTEVRPYGVQRGVAADLSVQGSRLDPSTRIIAPFAFTATDTEPKSTLSALRKFKITVAPDTPVGIYSIRVRTDEGLSNPVLFAVGQLPQVAEKEDNSTFDAAQPVPANAVVEGQAPGNDVDFFRFPGKKGQRILVDAQCARIGSGVDPTIRLTTAGRTYVASADDTAGLLTDARLVATLPEDGDYVVELSDSRYQGAGRPIYRLVIGEVPTAEEVFPLGGRAGEVIGLEYRGGTVGDSKIAAASLKGVPGLGLMQPRMTARMLGLPGADLDLESAAPLVVSTYTELRESGDPAAPPPLGAVPVVFNGRIDSKGDEDVFRLRTVPGERIRIKVDAASLGSALDGVLQVKNPAGAVLATADDVPNPLVPKGPNGAAPAINTPDPSLDFAVPAGTNEVLLTLKDLKGEGGIGFPYRITVEPHPASSFDITLGDAQASLPKGGTAAIPVTIARQNYNGPITLTAENLPPGVTVKPGTVFDGQLVGVLTLEAAPDASFDLATIKVVGEGKAGAVAIRAEATKPIVFAQQATLPTKVVVFDSLALAANAPTGIKAEVPAAFEVVHGFGGPIPIKLTRGKEAEDALAVAAYPLPPGVTVPASNIAAKAVQGSATVNVTTDVPLGSFTIALNAKGKIQGKDRMFALPAVTLNVVRPVAVEAPANLEIKAGTTAELKGKVVRKAPFKDPVTIKLDGLPAGVKADPVTVPGDKADFVVKLTADAKAAAATGAAKATAAFQINKKDYPTPPAPVAIKVTAAK